MGSASSAPGVALLVPGYFVCAGLLLFAAVIAAVVGIYRRPIAPYLAFAATCLFSAGVAASTAAYYLSDSVAGAVSAQRWLATWTLLIAGGVATYVALYTEEIPKARWRVVMGASLAVLLAANATLPLGVKFSAVESFGWLHYPWGESLFTFEGRTGPWNVAYRGVLAAFAAWMFWRLFVHYRRGRRRATLVLGSYLALLFLCSLQASLIDYGYLRTFHWSAFALVGLALLAGVTLLLRLREQNAALEQTARLLREENLARREAEARIRERAFTDPLTGLPNWLFLQERMGALIDSGAAGSHGAVLYCDLDHFKVVNDALSHAVGDEVLRELGARLVKTAAGEAWVARTGGDGFGAVLERMHEDEGAARARVEAMARAMLEAVQAPFVLGERTISLSASLGVATFQARRNTAGEVIGRAEMALHRAKKRGRNNVQVFEPALHAEAAEQFRIVAGLRRALESDELALHYQPLVDGYGKVVGAEALMRWNSRAMGPIPPSTFIPVAEETGLIHSLGEWSLRQGCERLAEWKRTGVPFDGHLAVNVSPWQLARPDFVGRLRAILQETGVDPRQLTLEITESAVLFDIGDTVAKLRELRPLGVRMALDDFGTGYSSLALIKDLPLDAIKIDQSFIRHLGEGPNRQLVRVIVAIGHELGLAVIAEGVESEAVRLQLAMLGCRHFQGYHFCGPVAEPAFCDWLRGKTLAFGVSA